jgi:hypothetical protein
MKKTFAAQVCVKASKIAIVIGVSHFKDARIPSFAQGDDMSQRVASSLTAGGWNVKHFHTSQSNARMLPTRKNVLSEIQTAKALNAFVLVYWCGYGVDGTYFNWPTYKEHFMKWIALDAADRALLYAEQERSRGKLWTIQRAEKDKIIEIEREVEVKKEEELAKQREGLLKKEQSAPRKSWTRVQPPTTAPAGAKRRPSSDKITVEATKNMEKRRNSLTRQEEELAIERRLEYLREIQPLPFTPSAPIRLFDLPEEEVQRTDPFLYLIPQDGIYEMNRYYDITYDDLRVATLGPQPVMGSHAALIVDACCPFVLGKNRPSAWSALAFSNGEERIWRHDTSQIAYCLLSHYLLKALEGHRCPHRLDQIPFEEPKPVNAGIEGVHALSLGPYLTKKIAQHDGPSGTQTLQPATMYIGELLLSHHIAVSMTSHKIEKSSKETFIVTVHAKCREMLDVQSVTFRDIFQTYFTSIMDRAPFTIQALTSEGEWTLHIDGINVHDYEANPESKKAVEVALSELGSQATYKELAGLEGVDIAVRSNATMARNTLHVHARIRTLLNGMVMMEQQVAESVFVSGAHQSVVISVETTARGYEKLQKTVWNQGANEKIVVEKVLKIR